MFSGLNGGGEKITHVIYSGGYGGEFLLWGGKRIHLTKWESVLYYRCMKLKHYKSKGEAAAALFAAGWRRRYSNVWMKWGCNGAARFGGLYYRLITRRGVRDWEILK